MTDGRLIEAAARKYFSNRSNGNYGRLQEMFTVGARLFVRGAGPNPADGDYFEGRRFIGNYFQNFGAASNFDDGLFDLVIIERKAIMRWNCSFWDVETRTLGRRQVVNFLTLDGGMITELEELYVILTSAIITSALPPGFNEETPAQLVYAVAIMQAKRVRRNGASRGG